MYAQRQRIPPQLIQRRLRFPATRYALQHFAPSPRPALHLIQHFLMLAGMHLLQQNRTFQSAFPSMGGPAHHGIKLPSLNFLQFVNLSICNTTTCLAFVLSMQTLMRL